MEASAGLVTPTFQYRQVFGGITKRAKGREDVRLSLPILRLHLLAQVLVDGGRPDRVEEGEDFEFFLHAIWCA